MNIEDINEEKKLSLEDIVSNIIKYINSSQEDNVIDSKKIKIGTGTIFEPGYDPIIKMNSIGGKYKTSLIGSRMELFPNKEIALRIVDDNNNDVFKTFVSGENVGDIVIGDFDKNQGLKYDKSENKIIFSGILSAASGTLGTITSGTITGVSINGSIITGGTIQTATSGLRVRLSSGSTNKIEFLKDNVVQGLLEIIQNGDDFLLRLGGDSGGYFKIISSMGVSAVNSVSMPFINAWGKASIGQVVFSGSPNHPTAVGLEWSDGGVGYFNFNLGQNLARINSNIFPSFSNTYDLGSSTYKWRRLMLSGGVYADDGYYVGTTNIVTSARIIHSISAVHQSWAPNGDNIFDLGLSGARWRNVYVANNLIIGGTVDGVDVSSHAANPDAHHSSTSSGISITPSSVTSSGKVTGTILNTTSGIEFNGITFMNFQLYSDHGRIIFQRGAMGCDLLPYGDNYGQIGYDNRRWSRVRAIVIQQGDLIFENNFRFTEEDDMGISLYNPKNEKIAVFMENGDLYIRGQVITGENKIFNENIKQSL